MNELMTWVFLSITLPQIGADQDALLREQYRQNDRSSDQSPDELVFSRQVDVPALGAVQVSAVTRARKVTALVVTTDKSADELVGLVERDARCTRGVTTGFSCRFGDDAAAVNVSVCKSFVVLDSAQGTGGRSQASALCGGPEAHTDNQHVAPYSPLETQPSTQTGWINRNLGLVSTLLGSAVALLLVYRTLRARKARPINPPPP